MEAVRYVTFGHDHTHRVNGETFDCNSVAKVYGDRDTVVELFGLEFCYEYQQPPRMMYFSRGIIEANSKPREPAMKKSEVELVRDYQRLRDLDRDIEHVDADDNFISKEDRETLERILAGALTKCHELVQKVTAENTPGATSSDIPPA